MDDQPVWMRTGRAALSVPYPHEVNDVAFHHGTAGAFAEMMIDNLDELLEQSAQQPLVCGIVTHSFSIVGQPYRLHRFRTAVEHLIGLPGVWITTGRVLCRIEAPPAAAHPTSLPPDDARRRRGTWRDRSLARLPARGRGAGLDLSRSRRATRQRRRRRCAGSTSTCRLRRSKSSSRLPTS